jgi:hypothetical protein
MFDYINRKRDPVSLIFYSGLIPFALFWIFARNLIAGFCFQAYLVTAVVFVFYPYEMHPQLVRKWQFWNRLLRVGLGIHLLVLLGLWYLDSTFPALVMGTGTLGFVGLVVGIVEMIAVGEVVDHSMAKS